MILSHHLMFVFAVALKSEDAEKLIAHLDIKNQRTFEIADLAKLIKQVCVYMYTVCKSVMSVLSFDMSCVGFQANVV